MRAILITAILLTACTSAQINTALHDGQLVCAVGEKLVTLATPAGLVLEAAAVDLLCGVVGGIAVSQSHN